MMRRLLLGIVVLASACTRAPVDTASPSIASECQSTELETCVASCQDSACLEWCAGESCAAAIASLSSCIDDGLQTDSLREHWNASCEPICSAQVVPPSEGPSFCADWRAGYYARVRLSEAPPEASGSEGVLGIFDSLALASSMWLVSAPTQPNDEPHTVALGEMVHRASSRLGEIDSCVPDLDEQGREFFVAVEFDPTGAVKTASVHGEVTGGDCVASMVATALALPIRVTRDHPQLEVRVLVKPLAP